MVLVLYGLSSLRKVTSNNPISRNRSTSDIINIINNDPKGYMFLKLQFFFL